MHIVDTHCHAGINWFEPVESIHHQMELNDVDQAILIQHGGNYHNDYIIECVKRFPDKFQAVVWVDSDRPDAPETLEQLSQQKEVVGLRLYPSDRSPGTDPLAIWRKADELGLKISCFVRGSHEVACDDFHTLVEQLPNLSIVLEHLAGAYRPLSPDSVTPPYDTYQTALKLSEFPNIYIKFGGLGEFSIRPRPLHSTFGFDEVPPLIEMAYDAFGAQRMMWGSDYPPVGGREGYHNSLIGVKDLPLFKNDEDKEWAFGKTALKFFQR